MRTIQTAGQIKANGYLDLHVPVDMPESEVDVVVVVQQRSGAKATPAAKTWRQFLEKMSGSLTDPTFTRGPQLAYEVRQAFP